MESELSSTIFQSLKGFGIATGGPINQNLLDRALSLKRYIIESGEAPINTEKYTSMLYQVGSMEVLYLRLWLLRFDTDLVNAFPLLEPVTLILYIQFSFKHLHLP